MEMKRMKEGIIKFEIIFEKAEPVSKEDISCIDKWRRILFQKGLIGSRGGIGYGNLSVAADRICNNKKAFIITGSQTGNMTELTEKDYCIVTECDFEKNRIFTKGRIMPSSEAMTHGALYYTDDRIKSIIHVHSSDLWENAEKLDIPIIDKDAEYGSLKMAYEIIETYKKYKDKKINLFAMAGHRDGIVSFGKDPDHAGYAILEFFEKLGK